MGEDRQRTYNWADPEPAALAARELDGYTFTKKMLEGELQPPPIGPTLGYGLYEVEKGRVVFHTEPAEFQCNPVGGVHGGVIATLLDSAAGAAVQTLLEAGTGIATLDLSVKYVRGVTVKSGQLLCEGNVIHMGKRTALSEARLYGKGDTLHAQATANFMIFRS